MLSFDFESKLEELKNLQNDHELSVNFLQNCTTDEYIDSANNLAQRIILTILEPIKKSIDICEMVTENGVEKFPIVLLIKWINEIEHALVKGGIFNE